MQNTLPSEGSKNQKILTPGSNPFRFTYVLQIQTKKNIFLSDMKSEKFYNTLLTSNALIIKYR